MIAALITHARAKYVAATGRSETLSENVAISKYRVTEKTCEIKTDSSDNKANFCNPAGTPKNVPRVKDLFIT